MALTATAHDLPFPGNLAMIRPSALMNPRFLDAPEGALVAGTRCGAAGGHDRATRMPDCQRSTRTAGGSIVGQATDGIDLAKERPNRQLWMFVSSTGMQANAHAERRFA